MGFIYAYHDKQLPGQFFLIDGQQRVMALCSALVGRVILTDDYEEKVIKIALGLFRGLNAIFI